MQYFRAAGRFVQDFHAEGPGFKVGCDVKDERRVETTRQAKCCPENAV